MFRRLAGFLGLALLAATSLGQLQGYAQRTQNIRAGILTLDSSRYGPLQPAANDTPFVWLNIDSNARVKPVGWTFYNPNALGVVDAATAQRWGSISTIVGGTGPNAGDLLDKRKAAYWEVSLTTASDVQLSQYDVLLFSGYRFISLNPGERDKLRRFVDRGGILWVDINDGTNIDVPNNFPIPFAKSTATAPLNYADVFNPVLSTPFRLGMSDLESIATDGDRTNLNALFFTSVGISGIDHLETPLPEESQKLNPVAGNANGPALSVGRLGDGFVVVTARGYANAINRVRLSSNQFDPNNRYQSVYPNTDRTADTASRLVINMINLASGYGQTQAGSRKANSSFVDIGMPLLKRFDARAGAGQNSALEYKGLLVVTTDTQVIVYDANPASDLDADGDPDDGIQDYALGAGYDEIWESVPLTGPISPATCAEVPNGNNVPTDQIMVVDGNGQLVVFNAFPVDPNGRLAGAAGQIGVGAYKGYTVAPPATAGTFAGGPYPAPTFHENVAVIADTITTGFGNPGGHIWLVDTLDGVRIASTGDFQLGNGILPEFSGSPLVGYIPIADNSGGVDRVIYTAGKASTNGAFPTADITSIWLGAKGESPGPGSATVTPGVALTVDTRAFKQGLPIFLPNTTGPPAVPPGSGLGVKLTIIDPTTGDPWDATTMANVFDNSVTSGQPGELVFGIRGGGPGVPVQADGVTPNVGIRVDYTIDWGAVNAAQSTSIIRGSIGFPDDLGLPAGSRRHILGDIALSPRGTLYAVLSTGDPSSDNSSGGSFYEVREQGRGAFQVLVRYDLYPPHTFPVAGGTSVNIPATVDDNDDLTNLPGVGGFLGGPFNRLTFVGGPTVRNGVVYVTAQGRKAGASPVQSFIPFSILMAFKGEPDLPTIKVGDFPDGSVIIQPDITQTSGGQKRTPNRYNTLQNAGANSQYTYDSNTGIITINNLANVNRGQIGSALSLSQPIIVKSPLGAGDRWFWPDATGSNWSPLLWYTVHHGASNNSAPFATGNSVFMAGTSALPNLITSGFTVIRNSGLGWGMDATIAPDDPFLVTNAGTGRPWINQVENLKINGGSPTNPNISSNPDMRWPQQVGIISYDTWIQRILQTQIGNSTLGFATQGTNVIGGDRSLILVGTDGAGNTYYSGFSRSDVVVADQGRVARFDPGGNPIWSTDVTLESGLASTGPTGDTSGLVRPTRAYLFGDSDVLAVDPATNRIIRLDATGHEVRTIKGFKLDPVFTPEGYKINEKTSFDSPADVATYGEFVPGPRIAANPMSNAAPLEYWFHYVVADSGNHRIVDIVDRYVADPTTRRVLGPVTNPADNSLQLGVLAWHSPASLESKQFNYTSITRIVPTTITNAGYYYVAGVGNQLPTRTDVGLVPPSAGQSRQEGDGNGGIVIFNPSNSTPPDVISEVQVPDIPANVFWNDTTGTFNSPAQPGHLKRLSSLMSITARNIGSSTAIMFTDATGVYEVVPTGGAWQVQWMLPNEAYRVMRGVYNIYDTTRPAPFNVPGVPSSDNPADCRPTYARRLDSGEVLIVNGYSGVTRGNLQIDGSFLNRLTFGGEVVQVDGGIDQLPVNPANPNANPGFSFQKTNLGFGYLSLKFQLPPISGARPVLQPVFADRR